MAGDRSLEDIVEDLTEDATDQWLTADANARLIQGIATATAVLGVLVLLAIGTAAVVSSDGNERWFLVCYAIGVAFATVTSYALTTAVGNIVATGAHALRLQAFQLALQHLDQDDTRSIGGPDDDAS